MSISSEESENNPTCGECGAVLDYYRDGHEDDGYRCHNCYWEEQNARARKEKDIVELEPEYRPSEWLKKNRPHIWEKLKRKGGNKNRRKTMKNKGGADSNQKPGGIPRPQMRRETRDEALRRLDAAHAEMERREEALRRERELLTTNPATPIYNRVRVALFDGLHGPPGHHDTHPPFHYVNVASQQLSNLFLVRGLHEEQISPQRTALQGILEDILTQFEEFITVGDVGGDPTITYNTIQDTIRRSNISQVISTLQRSGSYPDAQAANVLREYIYSFIPTLDPSGPAPLRPSSTPSSLSSLRGGKKKKKRRTRKKNKKTTQKRFPIKYLPNKLTKKDRKKQKKELLKSQEDYKKGIYHTREKVKSYDVKPSKYVVQAKKMYDIDNVKPSKELAKKTGCSIKGLNAIVKKGQGAYYSSGSRPNQSGHSWGIARMASVITGNKAAAVDFHIVEKYCDKTKKGYKTALKGKKKHGRGTRKVRKVS